MNLQNIIIIIVAIVIGLLLLRFVTKMILKIIVFVMILGLAAYLLFFASGRLKISDNPEDILIGLQEKYCNERLDTVKCECIVFPLLRDLRARYEEEQINELSEDPVKTSRIFLQLIKQNKAEIKECLKKHDTKFTLKDLLDDIGMLDGVYLPEISSDIDHKDDKGK